MKGVRVRSNRSGASSTTVTVDSAAVKQELKQARRIANKNVRDGIKRAIEEAVVPEAKRRAPGFVRMNIGAGSQRGSGYLTFVGKGRLRKAGGLMNFGGTRKDVIRPKNGEAVLTPMGPRAEVSGPRKYKGKFFLQKGRDAGLPRFESIVMDYVMEAFDGLPHN